MPAIEVGASYETKDCRKATVLEKRVIDSERNVERYVVELRSLEEGVAVEVVDDYILDGRRCDRGWEAPSRILGPWFEIMHEGWYVEMGDSHSKPLTLCYVRESKQRKGVAETWLAEFKDSQATYVSAGGGLQAPRHHNRIIGRPRDFVISPLPVAGAVGLLDKYVRETASLAEYVVDGITREGNIRLMLRYGGTIPLVVTLEQLAQRFDLLDGLPCGLMQAKLA